MEPAEPVTGLPCPGCPQLYSQEIPIWLAGSQAPQMVELPRPTHQVFLAFIPWFLLCKRQHSPGAKRVNTSQTTESLFPGVLCATVQLHLPSSGRGRAAPGREYKVTKDGLAQSRHSEGGWFMLLSGMGQL